MNIITGIDRPTRGTVTVDGRRLDEMSEEELAVSRGRRVGRLSVRPAASDAHRAGNAVPPLDFSRRRAALRLSLHMKGTPIDPPSTTHRSTPEHRPHLARTRREHEKFYAESPLHDAIDLQQGELHEERFPGSHGARPRVQVSRRSHVTRQRSPRLAIEPIGWPTLGTPGRWNGDTEDHAGRQEWGLA
jgi:hypothetical protein